MITEYLSFTKIQECTIKSNIVKVIYVITHFKIIIAIGGKFYYPI